MTAITAIFLLVVGVSGVLIGSGVLRAVRVFSDYRATRTTANFRAQVHQAISTAEVKRGRA